MVDESALLDLKHLLMEAQQRVPPVLMALEDPDEEMDEVWYGVAWYGVRCAGGCVAVVGVCLGRHATKLETRFKCLRQCRWRQCLVLLFMRYFLRGMFVR